MQEHCLNSARDQELPCFKKLCLVCQREVFDLRCEVAMSPAAVDDAEQQGPAELSEAYVHSLASLGLERLQNEPGRLHAEAMAVDEVTLTAFCRRF